MPCLELQRGVVPKLVLWSLREEQLLALPSFSGTSYFFVPVAQKAQYWAQCSLCPKALARVELGLVSLVLLLF